MYHEMAKHISADTVVLMDPKTVPQDLDRVLSTMMHESRPVYIGVPVDMSHLGCDASGLKTPIRTTFHSLFADEDFAKAEAFRLVELKLGYLDAPVSLSLATAAVEEFNKKKVVNGSMGG